MNLLVASAASPPPDTPLRLGNGITVRGSTRLEVRTEGTHTKTGTHSHRQDHTLPGEKESGSERKAGETQTDANTCKSGSTDVAISREGKRNRPYSTGIFKETSFSRLHIVVITIIVMFH